MSDDRSTKRLKFTEGKPTDVIVHLLTSRGSTPFAASRYKLQESCRLFKKLFVANELKEVDLVIPDDCEDEAVLLLDHLHRPDCGASIFKIAAAGYSSSSERPHNAFTNGMKIARIANQFELEHAAFDEYLQSIPGTMTEAQQLAEACPFLAEHSDIAQKLLIGSTYDVLVDCKNLKQLEERCDQAHIKPHGRATLMLKWLATHPGDEVKINVGDLRATYIRHVLLAYALRYPHIAKQFEQAILTNIDRNEENTPYSGMHHGMVWGVPFKSSAGRLVMDLAWMGLEDLRWELSDEESYVRVDGLKWTNYIFVPSSVVGTEIGFTC